MQKNHETKFYLKTVLVVFNKLKQCLGNAAEQNIDHYFFIAQNDRIELMDKGKDIVMIYTHVLQQGGYGVASPPDDLGL
jgi:hypothetical protein